MQVVIKVKFEQSIRISIKGIFSRSGSITIDQHLGVYVYKHAYTTDGKYKHQMVAVEYYYE